MPERSRFHRTATTALSLAGVAEVALAAVNGWNVLGLALGLLALVSAARTRSIPAFQVRALIVPVLGAFVGLTRWFTFRSESTVALVLVTVTGLAFLLALVAGIVAWARRRHQPLSGDDPGAVRPSWEPHEESVRLHGGDVASPALGDRVLTFPATGVLVAGFSAASAQGAALLSRARLPERPGDDPVEWKRRVMEGLNTEATPIQGIRAFPSAGRATGLVLGAEIARVRLDNPPCVTEPDPDVVGRQLDAVRESAAAVGVPVRPKLLLVLGDDRDWGRD